MKEITVDCMYEACPIPLLRLVQQMEKISIGDVVILTTDHTCAITNIEDWIEKEGHGLDYVEIEPGIWEIYVEKRR